MKILWINILTDKQINEKINTAFDEVQNEEIGSLRYEVSYYRDRLVDCQKAQKRMSDEHERITTELIKMHEMKVLAESIEKIKKIILKNT